jgi:hypothetical protein
MSKHKEALDILIHELSDFVGAETYCVTNGQSTGVISSLAADDDVEQLHTPARSSSLNTTSINQDKPLPIIPSKDLEEENEEYLSPEVFNERKTLFTMLLTSYLSIKDR